MLSQRKGLVLLSLFLASCAQEQKPAPATQAAPAAPAAPSAAEVAMNQALAQDHATIAMLEAMAPITEPERQAILTAKEKMALVKSTFATAEADKKTALDAKGVYGDRLKDYQAALAQADAARQARAKAMAALAAAQKEIDDSWAAVAAARDALNKAIVDPKGTPEQRTTAEANLAKAYARTEQAEAALNQRTLELQAAQKNGQGSLTSVTRAAEIASSAGRDYAAKVNVANQSIAAYNGAVAEERKAMGVIFAMNQARAKVVAQNLANAAYNLAQARDAAANARAAAASAANAQKNASERLNQATKDAANAKLAAANAAQVAADKAVVAQEKANAKAVADAAALQAQKIYADAKATFDAASAVSNKSAADARAAAAALNTATAKNAAATKALDAAIAANKANDNPATQQALANAQAAAAAAAQALLDAQAKNDAAAAKATADAATTAQVKADHDAKLATYRQAASAQAAAAKESAIATANAQAAAKASENANAVAAARAQDAAKASTNLDSATSASQAAANRSAAATQAEADARARYHSEYQKNEVYKLSPTQSEQEMQAEDQKLFPAALWAGVPEGNYWTTLVVAAVRQNQASLERARDLNEWCPGYFDASQHQKEVCWLRLVGGLVKFESSFKPDDAFKESNGNWSVGLMALSPRECKNYESVDMLKQPLLNLSCGIGKFADLVEREGYIAGPAGSLGASKYWSTLRAPYTQERPDGKGVYKLGKKYEIIPFTKVYRNY